MSGTVRRLADLESSRIFEWQVSDAIRLTLALRVL
jgi:hypothetical protein